MITNIEELKDFISLEEKKVLQIKIHKVLQRTQKQKHKENFFLQDKSVLRNELKLYDKITYIINAFTNKDIYSGNVEKDVHYKPEESETEFEESTAERTKIRRQKFDEENQKGQGLKILMPDQMLSRLPFSLAQLKARND